MNGDYALLQVMGMTFRRQLEKASHTTPRIDRQIGDGRGMIKNVSLNA